MRHHKLKINDDSNPNFKQLERRHGLTRDEFIEEYAQYGLPVIVTGAIDDWNWEEITTWTATGLNAKFPGKVHSPYPSVGDEKFFEGKVVGFYNEKEIAAMLPGFEEETKRKFEQKNQLNWPNRDPAISQILQESYDLPQFLEGVGEKEVRE